MQTNKRLLLPKEKLYEQQLVYHSPPSLNELVFWATCVQLGQEPGSQTDDQIKHGHIEHSKLLL